MESLALPKPIQVAEIPILTIDDEVIRAFDRTKRDARINLLNEKLGLIGLDCAPEEYRLENASYDPYIDGNMSYWHVDGLHDRLAEVHVLGQPFAPEVLETDSSIKLESLWDKGYRDLDQRLLQELIDHELAKIVTLKPNFYYRLAPGTIHRRPPIQIGKGNRRIFGRRLSY